MGLVYVTEVALPPHVVQIEYLVGSEMIRKHFNIFLAAIIALVLLMTPCTPATPTWARTPVAWKDKNQTMIDGGKSVSEKLADNQV
jgi:hypothetical protein